MGHRMSQEQKADQLGSSAGRSSGAYRTSRPSWLNAAAALFVVLGQFSQAAGS